MTDWWEPPFAGTEEEQLIGALDRQRATFRWKVDGLDAEALGARAVPSTTMTLGGLLKHLAAVEATNVLWKMFGDSPGEPWASLDWENEPDWDFRSAAEDSPAELYEQYDEAVARSRARLAEGLAAGGLEQEAHVSDGDGHHASVRRVLCDLLEEYGRHVGHADLLREAVDGLTGEDPTPGWTPSGGTA